MLKLLTKRCIDTKFTADRIHAWQRTLNLFSNCVGTKSIFLKCVKLGSSQRTLKTKYLKDRYGGITSFFMIETLNAL